MKGWVDVIVHYSDRTSYHAGRARTEAGIMRHACGGGDAPGGPGWHAEIEGTLSDLEEIGAVYNPATKAWRFTDRKGRSIKCVELLARVTRGMLR